ncbi:protein angel homolog 2 isoform X2 [Aphidius gifuensis]|uniref:protein angel homolog 2 isoform X2 n=1 Tax=Aphidius gifuensis TaxID=684658 RepID=UPI001CDB553F|nr:protein angel homolog 2 isoform X2 [Aphidius gifuensis]
MALSCHQSTTDDIDKSKQILHMSEIPTKYLLRGNLKKCSSTPKAFYSTFEKLLKSKNSSKRDSKKNKMEPILELCLSKNDSSRQNNYVSNNNIPSNHYVMSKKKYNEIRQWKTIEKGTSFNADTDFALRLLSYNILAQNLLETHSYLYKNHNYRALDWKHRKFLIQQEILNANANVICIQEMQVEHCQEFLVPLRKQGFDYLYKKRTNDTKDGLLMLYRPSQLKLEDYSLAEFHQTNSDILNRDNVGIVAKFSLRESPDTHIVISTTHLLYNPKRNDVRLAQTQLLFAEIERVAFIENTVNGPKYHPILLCGDFNLVPQSGVYKFITDGSFKYAGKGRSLDDISHHKLTNQLIPSHLRVTDNCEHFDLLKKRISHDNNDRYSRPVNDIDRNTSSYQNIELTKGKFAKFSSGTLSHPHKLTSVYKHKNDNGEFEATTHQDEWITVDYIFYSQVEVLDRYTLPTVSECEKLSFIPNFIVGSDHVCLGATFKLKKKNFDKKIQYLTS